MLKILIRIVIVFCLCDFNAIAQKDYNLSFNLDNAVGHKFYLLDIYGGLKNEVNQIPIDSIQATSDTFSFRGSFNESQFYSLAMDSSKWFLSFIIDTGKLLILGNADSFPDFRIRESWENDKLRSFGLSTNSLVYKMNEAAGNKNTELYSSLLNTYFDSIIKFTKLYPNSYGLFFKAGNFMNDEERFKIFGKKWYPLISDKLKNHNKR